MKCPTCGHDIIDPVNDPIVIRVKKYMDDCNKKFKDENPCPKCGSHDVDCDWGSPTWCNNCGHEWD